MRTRKEALINSILDNSLFFKHGVLLWSERQQLFQTNKEYTNFSAFDDASYEENAKLHPQYDPICVGLIKELVPADNGNCKDFKPKIFHLDTPNLYFTLIKPQGVEKGYRRWLLFQDNSLFILQDDTNALSHVFGIREFKIHNRFIVVKTLKGEEKFKIKSEASEPKMISLLNSIFINEQSKPLEWFFECILFSGGYPPVCKETFSFYHTVVTNPYFLYLFTQVNEDTKVYLIKSWINATGNALGTILPLLLYTEYQSYSDPKEMMNKPSWIRDICLYIIRFDEEFKMFTEKFELDQENTQMHFINSFQNVHFSALSNYILFHVANEAARRFPNSQAHYYAVSNLLFKVILGGFLKMNGKSLDPISSLINFDDTKCKIGQILNLQTIIDELLCYPNDLEINIAVNLEEENIRFLMEYIGQYAEQYAMAAQNIDIMSIVSKYKALVSVQFCILPISPSRDIGTFTTDTNPTQDNQILPPLPPSNERISYERLPYDQDWRSVGSKQPLIDHISDLSVKMPEIVQEEKLPPIPKFELPRSLEPSNNSSVRKSKPKRESDSDSFSPPPHEPNHTNRPNKYDIATADLEDYSYKSKTEDETPHQIQQLQQIQQRIEEDERRERERGASPGSATPHFVRRGEESSSDYYTPIDSLDEDRPEPVVRPPALAAPGGADDDATRTIDAEGAPIAVPRQKLELFESESEESSESADQETYFEETFSEHDRRMEAEDIEEL